MINTNCNFTINGVPISLDVKTKKLVSGKDEVLYVKHGGGIDTNWDYEGYTITNFLEKNYYNDFMDVIYNLIKEKLELVKKTKINNFILDQYHTYVNDEEHYKFLKHVTSGTKGINGIPLSVLPFDSKLFDKLISDLCGRPYTTKKTFFKVFTNNHFWLRVVRPQKTDNNPPHRDCYFKKNTRIINIYAPIAGSNWYSSLPIMPGSHYINEKNIINTKGKTLINGVRFSNPGIISCKKGLDLITPNPPPGQLMVFTPYTIHGGGCNRNLDKTRISLEMRFWWDF